MYNILQLYENLFYENNKNHEKLTKLWKADKTSFVEDYTTSWKDCNNILGGEILLFVQTNNIFEKPHPFEEAGMKIFLICFKTTKSTWLELYNVYLPNTTTHQNSFNPSLIKTTPTSIIPGNFTTHSQLWDSL